MKLKEDYFTKLLNLENGTPSHDCLSDVFAAIDSKKFMEIFIEWTKEILKKQIKSQFESYNNLYGNENIQYHKTIEKGRGRIGEREYFLCYDVSKIEEKEK